MIDTYPDQLTELSLIQDPRHDEICSNSLNLFYSAAKETTSEDLFANSTVVYTLTIDPVTRERFITEIGQRNFTSSDGPAEGESFSNPVNLLPTLPAIYPVRGIVNVMICFARGVPLICDGRAAREIFGKALPGPKGADSGTRRFANECGEVVIHWVELD